MSTKKSKAIKFMEKISGGSLTLAKIIRSHRMAAEYSQAELARLLKVSRAHVCDVENGRKFLSPEKAAEIARVLGMSEVQYVRYAIQESLNRTGLKLKVEIKAA